MKQVFFIVALLFNFSICLCHTMTNEEQAELGSKLVEAYNNREWEKVLRYCDTIDCYQLKHIDYSLLKAEALAGLKRYDEAIDYLKSLNDKTESYYITHEIGNIYWLKGDIDNAIYYYDLTIMSRPTYARPHINLGMIYQDLGQKEEAISHYMSAIKLFYANEFYDEIETYASNIIVNIDSTYINAYIYIERALHLKNNFEGAMRVCMDIDAWCVEHKEEGAIFMENIYHMGENTFYLGDYEFALDRFFDYLTMLNNRPYDDNMECGAWVYLGVIMKRAEDYQVAEDCFKKAREINEDRANSLLKKINERCQFPD